MNPNLARHLIPRSLAGQLIALLLLALIVAQAVGLFVFAGERRQVQASANRFQTIARLVTVVRLLEETEPAQHDRVLAAANSSDMALWLSETSAIEARDAVGERNPLRAVLRDRLVDTGVGDILVDLTVTGQFSDLQRPPPRPPGRRPGFGPRPEFGSGGPPRGGFRGRPPPPPGLVSLAVSVQLPGGLWLNAATREVSARAGWTSVALLSMGLTALTLIAVVIFTVRGLTRPMARLAAAADRAGRGENTVPLPEEGPEDIRVTTRAFNTMQDRLARFVQDRVHVLGAISHDLRSPITVLRLRAEFIDDQDTREKILATLDEMEEMTQAALTFVREESAQEETSDIDMASLVEAVCEDAADAGGEVNFKISEPVVLRGRTVGLKRAVRNLIANAVAYGGRARVHLSKGPKFARLTIEDDGPGIATEDHEQVFAPFFRLETSRNRSTGGVGLGLSIARTIVRRHGGDIGLENIEDETGKISGLRVTVDLPISQDLTG